MIELWMLDAVEGILRVFHFVGENNQTLYIQSYLLRFVVCFKGMFWGIQSYRTSALARFATSVAAWCHLGCCCFDGSEIRRVFWNSEKLHVKNPRNDVRVIIPTLIQIFGASIKRLDFFLPQFLPRGTVILHLDGLC